MTMPRALPCVLSALLIVGCASTAPAPEAEDLPWLDDYANDPFVPVNLYVNANQHVGEQRGRLLDYAARQLEDSGAFLRVDRGASRWLYSLELDFQPEPAPDGGTRLLSIVTLGLLPVATSRVERLAVEVFHEPEPAARFEFEQPYEETVSVFHAGDDPGARAAIDMLLRRVMAKIAAARAIPRARDFDQMLDPPAPPKKRPPKPKGTPT